MTKRTTFFSWTAGLFLLAAGAAAAQSTAAASSQTAGAAAAAPRFTLWQLPEQTRSQQTSYVLRTSGGKIAVVDGGTTGDAPYLRGFLAALGNRVDYWFITHFHSDHTEALADILKAPRGVQVAKIFGPVPSCQWLRAHSLAEDLPPLDDFEAACRDAQTTVSDLQPGMTLELDGVRFEILAGCNPEFTVNAINNQSLVMRVSDSRKSVLFTGDLGEEGGAKLLASPLRDKLRADYVQMAHHGQAGVSEEFYRAVGAKACLWPTPRWLWDNDNGGGKGSGPWHTLKTRAWMEKMGVTEHYVSADGLHRID